MMTEPEEISGSEGLQEASLSQAQREAVNADVVRMHQSAARQVQGHQVGLTQSAAVAVKADSVSVHQSALGAVEAEEFLSQRSAIANVQADKASVSGYTASVVAQNAEVHYGVTGVVVGGEVHAENARTLLLVGGTVTGNVTPLLDSRSALIAGLTGGLFAGLMLLLGRGLFGRK
jgi:hypothetical protein